MKSSAEKIAMKSYEDIFQLTGLEGHQANSSTLPLDLLRPFKHHLFRIRITKSKMSFSGSWINGTGNSNDNSQKASTYPLTTLHKTKLPARI